MSAPEIQRHPAGWYDDPSSPALFRFWDGGQWTEHTSPRVVPTGRHPVPLGSGFPRLAAWLGRLLRAMVLLQVVDLLVEGWGWLTIRRFEQDPAGVGVDPLDLYDHLTMLVAVAYLLLLVPTAVVWPIWQFRLARSVADRVQRSPGMHAGSWFIPFASLWLPVQNIRDLWLVLTPSGEERSVPRFVGWWWASWLGSVLADRLVFAATSSATSVGDYEQLALLAVVDAAVSLAAAVLAVTVVRRLTQRARERVA